MHSLVAVLGPNPDLQMAKFDMEESICEEKFYIMDEAEQKSVLARFAEKGEYFNSFAELINAHGSDYYDDLVRQDLNGEWWKWIRINPEGKWDWYQIGGRWPGRIVLKDGCEPKYPQFSYGYSAEQKKPFMDGKHADSAPIKDIKNLEELVAEAIICNGEWIDICGDVNFGPVAPHLKNMDENTLITFIDYHE